MPENPFITHHFSSMMHAVRLNQFGRVGTFFIFSTHPTGLLKKALMQDLTPLLVLRRGFIAQRPLHRWVSPHVC